MSNLLHKTNIYTHVAVAKSILNSSFSMFYIVCTVDLEFIEVLHVCL